MSIKLSNPAMGVQASTINYSELNTAVEGGFTKSPQNTYRHLLAKYPGYSITTTKVHCSKKNLHVALPL